MDLGTLGTTPVVDTARSVRRGLAWRSAETLAADLNITLERLSTLLDVPMATLYRRKRAKRLSPQESDRLVRFARLWQLAVQVFEDEAGARTWLESPQFGLSGLVPLDFAITEVGGREVEQLLHRIDRNVLV